jgi:hypothetical protein
MLIVMLKCLHADCQYEELGLNSYHYEECHYGECHYTEFHHAERKAQYPGLHILRDAAILNVVRLGVVRLSVVGPSKRNMEMLVSEKK